MLQNAPKPMGIGLDAESVARIAKDVPQITMVKEETPPCGQRVTAILDLTKGHLNCVFGGAGGRQIIDEMIRGSSGTLPACEITEVHVKMVAALNAGNEDLARELFERSLPLLNVQAVFRWRMTKYVLKMRGLIKSDYTRAFGPLMDQHDYKEVNSLLARMEDITDLSVAG